ncbi:tRNA lysidine(34) synthetase TilS [Candidatus Nitrosacidococcus tergens]|uniref:tRNA(Ile)-lysidine synthase n=1 Tax=Candidatus Nitrosacidococcus tergens TaxID=553981 RepID=A0A7G1QA14_9GAMM|nr:tRNA lysidine(34) synthetase TilS [Candidatus Nitrosacidococcus tergens]CAB1275691.1 tRNA(Ile)-lysidine synthase [Candidatus Nitrosacidococcus tergens]
MRFSSHLLFKILQETIASNIYRVAYSGGLDSHVLLYALAQLQKKFSYITVTALYIDHRLHPRSRVWGEHCHQVCNDLGVPCKIIKINVQPAKGQSLEAVAREARYQAFKEEIQEGECLLTAQHQDDQVETVLLQLFRGTGTAGLAAMVFSQSFGKGYLIRPLLNFTQQDLKDYAYQKNLSWIEDPSNKNTDFDRNYLRHQIIPTLKARWPGLGQTLSRVALNQRDASTILEDHASKHLQKIKDNQCGLSVRKLKALSPPICRNVLRYWLKQLNLPLPDYTHLQRILNEILPATEDTQPLIAWTGVEVRRYRDRIYAQPPMPYHNSEITLSWDGISPLILPSSVGGKLSPEFTYGEGLGIEFLQENKITVAFRQGGEKIYLKNHHHSIKKLFQQQGIPPWQRARIPMVFFNEKLVFVAGIGIDQTFLPKPQERGVVIRWLSH